MVFIDRDSLIDSSWSSSGYSRNSDTSYSYSLRSRNASTAMKRATICLIVVITLIFLLLNIYGLMEIWKFYKEAKKRPLSLETIVRQQQEEAARKAEERMKEMEDGVIRLLETTMAPTPSWILRSTTERTTTHDTTIHDWFMSIRTRGRVTPYYISPTTTTRRPTTVRYTTRYRTTATSPLPTTTTTLSTTMTTTTEPTTTTSTTTRIIVTRPQPTMETSTSQRIEVTRPHPHRHHGHHHHHTSSSSTISPTTESPVTMIQTTQTTPKVEISSEEVTIVTGLLDIGRGEWWEYRRPLEKYHEFMENLLSLRNNMVIFVDEASHAFVHKYRKNMGLMHRTKIHLITFDDLPLSRHLPYAQKIIEDELKNGTYYRYDQSLRAHPEAKSAEYDVLVCSKTYFLYNATLENPFDTDSFAWIDAGYGHGNSNVFPFDNVWKPVFPKGKVSVIKLTPEHDLITKYKIDELYRKNWSVVSGGFIGGDKRSLGQLHTIVHNKFIHLIYQNKVDDDQTLMVLAINSYPHLFSVIQGGWFDAFKLYSIDAENNFSR